MNASTRTMARIIGPFLLIAAATIAMRADDIDLIFPAFFQDAPLVIVTGVFTLMVGLTMIAAHQRWDNAAAIVISVLGWIVAFRGAVVMLAPNFAAALAAGVIANPILPIIAAIVTGLLGLWLTYLGWLAKPPTPKVPT